MTLLARGLIWKTLLNALGKLNAILSFHHVTTSFSDQYQSITFIQLMWLTSTISEISSRPQQSVQLVPCCTGLILLGCGHGSLPTNRRIWYVILDWRLWKRKLLRTFSTWKRSSSSQVLCLQFINKEGTPNLSQQVYNPLSPFSDGSNNSIAPCDLIRGLDVFRVWLLCAQISVLLSRSSTSTSHSSTAAWPSVMYTDSTAD